MLLMIMVIKKKRTYQIGGFIINNDVKIYVYEISSIQQEDYGYVHGESIFLNSTQLDELITSLQRLREQIT